MCVLFFADYIKSGGIREQLGWYILWIILTLNKCAPLCVWVHVSKFSIIMDYTSPWEITGWTESGSLCTISTQMGEEGVFFKTHFPFFVLMPNWLEKNYCDNSIFLPLAVYSGFRWQDPRDSVSVVHLFLHSNTNQVKTVRVTHEKHKLKMKVTRTDWLTDPVARGVR